MKLLGTVEPSEEDMIPSLRAREARVLRVVERNIVLTMHERRVNYKRLGGTDAEFDRMVKRVIGERL